MKRSPNSLEKRNFDEIDRAGFGAFVKRFPAKRNFDEIDRAGFGAFVKRFPEKRNFDESTPKFDLSPTEKHVL